MTAATDQSAEVRALRGKLLQLALVTNTDVGVEAVDLIDSLLERAERAEADAAHWTDMANQADVMCGIRTRERDEARAALAASERDAARFQWLSKNWHFAHGVIYWEAFFLQPQHTLADAIDAAIKGE